jgi:ferredoxin-NADP reductase
MAKLTFLLSERKQVAEATMSFRFELAGQSFPFQPGQFIRVGLPNPPHPDPKGNARSFSIASAPSDPFLLIASRMTGSAFKTSLAEVPLGAPVSISGPAGSFILDPNSRAPVALFAGGIGITPFRSMIRHVRENDPARRLTLVYANRCPEQAAFLEELEAWAKDSPNFHLLATMTQPEKSKRPWGGPTGYVDIRFVRQYLPELPSGGCYVAGPPRFVAAVTQTLREAGIDGEHVWTDEFTGY